MTRFVAQPCLFCTINSNARRSSSYVSRGVKLYKYAVRGRVSATDHKRSKSEQLVLGQQLSERQFASALSVMDTDVRESSSGSGTKGPDDIWDDADQGGHEIRVEPHVESWLECVASCHKLLKQANVRMANVAECKQKLRVCTSVAGNTNQVAKAYLGEFDGKIKTFTDAVDSFSLKVGTEPQPSKETVCNKIDEFEIEKTAIETLMRDNWDYVKRVNAALE